MLSNLFFKKPAEAALAVEVLLQMAEVALAAYPLL